MTVEQLIEKLSEMPQGAEVRLAQQPKWAFEYSVDNIAHVPAGTLEDGEGLDCEDYDDGETFSKDVVYIGEGHQLGYLPEAAQQALEWDPS